jgi:acetolactate synthase-1/2/3 large subunit
MCATSEKLFYGNRHSYNRFTASRLGAGLAAMFPGLASVDVTDADTFSAAIRTALDVDGPSVISVECAADELPPVTTFLAPLPAKAVRTKQISSSRGKRTDVTVNAH